MTGLQFKEYRVARRSILLVTSFIISFHMKGAGKIQNSTVILRGQIINCSNSSLHLEYKDRNYNTIEIEVKLDPAGNFYKSVNGIHFVQRVGFGQKDVSMTLLIAPGYDLEIRGDGKDRSSFLRSYVIKGIGASNNLYIKQFDSIIVARNNNRNIYGLQKEEYLSYLNMSTQLVDSFATVFFNRRKDSYSKDFQNLILFENQVINLYFVTYYVMAFKVKPQEAMLLVRSTLNKSLLRSLFNDKYLSSDIYVRTMKTNYLSYLAYLEAASESSKVGSKDPRLQLVARNYKGKIKDLILFDLLTSKIESLVAFENLAIVEDSLMRYADSFTNEKFVDSLQKNLYQKQLILIRTQVGKAAPSFSLESLEGRTYKLQDFLGKVVYIDLWASWCGPCRAETPFLKKIYDRFKDNKQIHIIGIGIKDKKADWLKAIEEDKPAWLQLIDNNDVVFTSYNAVSIPRYIIIDKQGNIVSFDAPRPSDTAELVSILNSQLDK